MNLNDKYCDKYDPELDNLTKFVVKNKNQMNL